MYWKNRPMITLIAFVLFLSTLATTMPLSVWGEETTAKHKNNSKYEMNVEFPEVVDVGSYLQGTLSLKTTKKSKSYKNAKLVFEKVSGPGDILFRYERQEGKPESVLNSGTVEHLNLPKQFEYQKTGTLKFSQSGQYVLRFQLVSEKGKLIAETTKSVKAESKIEDLGTQISNLTVMEGSFVTTQNGEHLIYTVVVGEPAKLQVLNAETKESLEVYDLPGAAGAWAVTVADNGKVYVGSYSQGHLYEYDPVKKTVVDLGQPVPGETVIWDLKPGKDGKIYGGTYPRAKAFQYDPATGFTDYGTMAAGEEYVRSVEYNADTNTLYAGVGSHAHLIKYNLTTGEKVDILPAEYASSKSVYDMDIEGGKLFARVENGTYPMLVIDLETEEVESSFSAHSRGVSPLAPDGETIYYTYGGKLLTYNIQSKETADTGINLGENIVGFGIMAYDDPEFPGYTLSALAGNYNGTYIKYNLETKKLQVTTLPLLRQPTEIKSIFTGPEGSIYSSGFLSGGIAIFDPLSNTKAQFSGVGQSEGITSIGNKIYYGVYPGAKIYEHDTTKPWKKNVNPLLLFDLKATEQDRPYAMLGVEQEGKLFIGTIPDYGKLGGALTVYDTTTKSVETFRNIVQNQSVISLAYRDGVVYGGTTIRGGLGQEPSEKEAKLFLYDVASKQKTLEFVPVSGAQSITALKEGPDGNIWGFADGNLFILDTETNEVIYSEEKFEINGARWGDAQMVWSEKDQKMYATIDGHFFFIDSDTKEITELHSGEIGGLAQDHLGNFYMKEKSHLIRYTVNDPTVSVTHVKLSEEEVTLKVAESIKLSALVYPEIATNKKVSWTSDNSNVASVDAAGNVLALNPGTANITVTTEDGQFTSICKITVTE
ncbi:uncharacterized protein YjdB [Fictibacillus halophilus]|uniref:Uncharacterized protein YjdB n=1 Tax=Fictibacillus halophilus TaxID=1610490 RepID=A0ABV2LDZ9_9BACL|nr:Ig-like domain-containing protein [Fictibacillus halophilus]